jgi:uncharacterized protein YhfF
MPYLPEGCSQPNAKELSAFWASSSQMPGLADAVYQVRWIGLDHDSTEAVLQLISAGDKTGTFTLPWIVEQTDMPMPASGDCIILIDYAGHPRILLQLTDIQQVNFGAITAQHTSVDGTPVRDLAIWKPLHTQYWNDLLVPFGKSVSDDMPVLIEKFNLLSR